MNKNNTGDGKNSNPIERMEQRPSKLQMNLKYTQTKKKLEVTKNPVVAKTFSVQNNCNMNSRVLFVI